VVGVAVNLERGDAIMLRDIRSQGEALDEAIAVARAQAADLRSVGVRRVILTGSGDSFIAATATEALFRWALDRPVLAIPSLDASRYAGVEEGDLVVVLSVSGEVARTIEAAHRLRSSGAFGVAITAAAGSTLAGLCDAVVTLPEPIDRTIPHSRDYTVMLAALACLLEALADRRFEELDRLPAIIADLVTRSMGSAERLEPARGRTWFLGAGPDRGTAMFGALKFWEAAGLEAWWDDLEEFGHGSQLMARPGDRAVLIAAGPGAQRASEMTSGLARMGLDVVLVGRSELADGAMAHLFTTDELDHRWHPFAGCVPVQALTYVEAHARGLDVSVPLAGQDHGAVYDEVHLEWTKGSRIVVAEDGDRSASRGER
jgi:glucosamine 6-phosphate synthetase-like amidotransferase/phosphosugar isomerase protein